MTDLSDAEVAELKRLHKLTGGETLIADDFCEDDGHVTRLGTYDGTKHYYHRTKTVAYFQHDEREDRDEHSLTLLQAESACRLFAKLGNALPRLLAGLRRRRAGEAP